MKILQISELLGYKGGAETYIQTVARGAAEHGHDSYFLHWGFGRNPEEFASVFEETTQLPRRPFACKAVVQGLIQDWAPDVVLVHMTATMETLEALAGVVPTARMVHDYDLLCLRRHKLHTLTGSLCRTPVGLRCIPCLGFLEKRADRPWLPIGYKSLRGKLRELALNKSLDRAIVASEYMREELLSHGFSSDRISVVPLFAERREPPPTSEQPGEKTVLFAGQMIKGKGPDLCLDAFHQVKTPDVRFVMAGDGNARMKTEALADAVGMKNRVTFAGWVHPSELPTRFDSASLSVVTSRFPEPFGLVGVEAMARMRPVVAFDVGGIPTWLRDGETGFLVPPEDTTAMARRIDQLLADDALRLRMGQAGYELFEKEFTRERFIANLLAALEQTVEDFEKNRSVS